MDRLTPIVAGRIEAPLLKLAGPISFWGGIDWASGRIIDNSHPQVGVAIGKRCLVIPIIIGSGGSSGTLAEVLRRGLGPAGIIIPQLDITFMTGIEVARRLYDTCCPMFVCDAEAIECFPNDGMISVSPDGCWELK